MTRQMTAIIEKEGDGCGALCPKLDIARQGNPSPRLEGICKRLSNSFRRRPLPKKTETDSVTIPVPDHNRTRIGILASILRPSELAGSGFE